jgi:hypothetical protein
MAARALGMIGSRAKEAVPALIEARGAIDSSPQFEAEAVESRRKIDPEAVSNARGQ